jgi:hypothetical protein
MLAAALSLLATPVLAQGEGGSGLQLSSEQQRTLYQNLIATHVKPAPAGVRVGVGTRLPRSVRLHPVPRRVQPAPVRRYRYAVADRRVVLVEPKDRRIVMILGVGF